MSVYCHISAEDVFGTFYSQKLYQQLILSLLNSILIRLETKVGPSSPRPFGLGDVPERRFSSPVPCIVAVIP